MASLLKNLASPFDASKSYKFGDRFLLSGHMYQVLESFSGELDMTKVSEVTLADLVKGGYPPCDNYAGVSLEASAVTTDDTNTYFNVPKAGYYNEDSKIFAESGNLNNAITISKLSAATANANISIGSSLYMNNNGWSTLSIDSFSKSTSGVSSCSLVIRGYSEVDAGGTATTIETVTTTFTEQKEWDISNYASIRIDVNVTRGSESSVGRGATASVITFS